MSQTYGIAKARALIDPCKLIRLKAQRDHLYTESALLERELEIFRSNRFGKPPREQPHFTPEQRAQIMQLAALRQWSTKQTADHFGLHANTINSWKKALLEKNRSDQLLGSPPWNRLHEGVRQTVHEIRRLCPEKDFGTRSIARQMVRAGIQISRASVRRILEEDFVKPGRRNQLAPTPPSHNVDQLLKPKHPHHVWHTDITEIRVLWKRFEIAAVLDGYSRKLLTIRVFARRPNTHDMNLLIKEALLRSEVTPQFLTSDHGSQFRKRFKEACERQGIKHVKGKVRIWQLNGKIERFFRTMKSWMRSTWMIPSTNGMQRRLNEYQIWYNEHRVHAAHEAHTPEDVIRDVDPNPTFYTAKGGIEPEIKVTRQSARGDPKLFQLEIRVKERMKAA
tara:strand:+ start:3314 stop:4492 length:1179 start_codon:yes stop_codon:yes gene_type:complete